MHKEVYKHTPVYCGQSRTLDHRVGHFKPCVRLRTWPYADLLSQGRRCVKCPPACLMPTEKMEESKARRIRWLSLFFYAAVVFSLPRCNTWRFMPGARCRELIACRCLCAFVFPSFSTRRQLSKPCLAVLGSAQSLRFHFSPLLQHSHLLDLRRNVKYSTVGLIGVCLLFVWICFSLRPLRTHCLHNARICH